MGRVAIYSSEQERREAQNQRRKLARITSPVKFTGVDGEGMGRGNDHKYVLLGIGKNNIQDSRGLQLTDIFEFLYSQYKTEPASVYAGFYLGYDFTQWLKQLPEERAWYLFTKQGIAKRQRTKSGGNKQPFPVRWKDWEFDILGMKRFKLRPARTGSWMYICDTGSFFQASFLKTIDPSKWSDPVVSKEEYETLVHGKARRDTAVLDADMVEYNTLENLVLGRVLARLASGLADMGIRLRRDEWFGPGQGAQKWLSSQKHVPTAEELGMLTLRLMNSNAGYGALENTVQTADRFTYQIQNSTPQMNTTEQTAQSRNTGQNYTSQSSPAPHPKLLNFQKILDLGRLSYYGGWFEIFCHGHIPGDSWEYDVNSAYPHIARQLPCLLHGTWTYDGSGKAPRVRERSLTIAHASVKGTHKHIGAMLHRHPDGRIVRPLKTRGWYWAHELRAAVNAGIIDTIRWEETWTYEPCDCEPPLSGLARLYDLRLEIGKDTPTGKAAKLVYNSCYGKFAQSIGTPRFGNSLYASLITAGCRTMILEAIASHPGVLMVATDAVFFRERHTSLPLSNKLGEWTETRRENLTLFKPGVYWDDKTRKAISLNQAPVFKSRGINANQFGSSIAGIDADFLRLGSMDYPKITFTSNFSMVTCQQALQWGKWELAGNVQSKELVQDADPVTKRHSGWWEDGIWWSRPYEGWWETESTPYDKTFGQGDVPRPEDYGIHPDGWILNLWKEGIHE